MARPRTGAGEKVLEAIEVLTEEQGFPPSVRQLADFLGCRSVGTVHRFMVRLREDGQVVWMDGKARTLRVVKA